VAFGALGLKTSRGIIWCGVVMAPILADHLAVLGRLAGALLARHVKLQPTIARGNAAINSGIAVLLLISAVVSVPWLKPLLPLPPEKAGVISAETPVNATTFLLENDLPGPVFHAMSFGSYLIWAAQPDYPVFVDSRIELYPPQVWQDYLLISAGAGDWADRLDAYGIRTMVLSPQEQPLLREEAVGTSGWHQVYHDDAAVVLTRR
jgi:hypothetical protein